MRLSARSSHAPARTSTAAIAAAVLLCALLRAASAAAASIAITLQLPDGTPLADAAVTVQPVGKKLPAPAPVHAVMDQMNRMFMPEVIVIPVGSTVSFPNSDSVSHQIYSFSPAKRFQLPLYRGKPYPPLLFDQTGVVILGCNIHDWMIGYIDVIDAPFYGVTDSRGSWSTELPNGRYEIKVWHPRMREESPALVRELTVDATDRAALILRLTKPLRLQPMEGQSGDTY
ncbi:MAG TPA: methylamine utilization protein [Steroidobacteraceae bacterium]|nr:methylamine utilization protein [Steroidobacteraceae bacterium]